MDDATREVSERDQSTVELDMIIDRRAPTGRGGQGGGRGAPPGAEGPPALPIAVVQSWGLV